MIFTSLGHKIVVRYARKPIWMPTAPSKLFRIPEHTFYSEEEVTQIRLLNHAYKCQEKSIREFMRQEFYLPSLQAGGLPVEFIEKEAVQDEQIFEENDRENERIAKLKEQVISDMMKNLEDKVMEEKLNQEDKFMEKASKADAFIAEAKQDPFSFVTPTNIEECIEKAMESPVDFNFCIDASGKSHKSNSSTR